MSTGLVFLYICAAFSCRGQDAMPGDGRYYESRLECVGAAQSYARARRISLDRWEIVCVERERPR